MIIFGASLPANRQEKGRKLQGNRYIDVGLIIAVFDTKELCVEEIIEDDGEQHPNGGEAEKIAEGIAFDLSAKNPKGDDDADRIEYPSNHAFRHDEHDEEEDDAEYVANESENKSPKKGIFGELFVRVVIINN
jgi:hypothetical protein